MEELYYSKESRKVPISHYKIDKEPIANPTGFRSINRRDTVKPGTLLGFCDVDVDVDTNTIPKTL